jgi:ABC-2 type transport system permease protein/lipopolysaccharide transport system permease protein
MLIACGVLALLFLIFWTAPSIVGLAALPLLLILFAFTYGVALIFSVSLVYLRDLRHILPIIMQMGVFATPVAYELSKIPERLHVFYCAMNPLGAVIEGFRDAVLDGQLPDPALTLAGACSSVVWLVVGYLFFKKLETGIADVA